MSRYVAESRLQEAQIGKGLMSYVSKLATATPIHLFGAPKRVLGISMLAVFAGLLACGPYRVASQPRNAPDLTQSLAQVEGDYIWNDQDNRYYFSDKEQIDQILQSQTPEIAVRVLVDCLDDLSPSKSTLNGNSVALGLVCYEALSQIVYHEETGPDGDIAAQWAGHLSPTATPSEMLAAKSAWSQVLKSRTYVFL
jgi:hypothetical protein